MTKTIQTSAGNRRILHISCESDVLFDLGSFELKSTCSGCDRAQRQAFEESRRLLRERLGHLTKDDAILVFGSVDRAPFDRERPQAKQLLAQCPEAVAAQKQDVDWELNRCLSFERASTIAALVQSPAAPPLVDVIGVGETWYGAHRSGAPRCDKTLACGKCVDDRCVKWDKARRVDVFVMEAPTGQRQVECPMELSSNPLACLEDAVATSVTDPVVAPDPSVARLACWTFRTDQIWNELLARSRELLGQALTELNLTGSAQLCVHATFQKP